MLLLSRKLTRDLREHWTQFVAVLLMSALSVLIFSGLEGGWRGIETELVDFAQDNQMPDAWISGLALTEDDAKKVEGVEGIEKASVVTSFAAAHFSSNSENDLTLSTSPRSGINEPLVVDGRPVSQDDGVWLDERYALANGVTTGDAIRITREGRDVELSVNGLILQPDKVAYTGQGLVAPDPGKFGYGVVSDKTAGMLIQNGGAQQVIQVIGDLTEVRSEVRSILGDRYGSFTDRETYPHVATAYERVAQIRSLSYLFSSLFLLVALLSIFTSIRRLTEIQRTEVATLRALGYSNSLIGWYFTAMGGIAVLFGGIVGLSLTPALSRYVLSTQKSSFALPYWGPAYTPVSVLLPLVLVLVCVIASWSATRFMRRARPAEGMRPDIGRAKRTPFERLPTLWQRVPYGSRWAIRDATSSPIRVFMGIVAITGCMMLLIAGFGMPDTLNRQVDLSYSEQYRYDTRLSISPQAQDVSRDRFEADVGPGQWIQQVPVRFQSHGEAEHILTVLGDGEQFRILDASGEPLVSSDGAVITERLGEQLGLDIGDQIGFEIPTGEYFEILITATTSISEPQGLLLSETAWRDAGGELNPTAYLTEGPPGKDAANLSGIVGKTQLVDQRENARSVIDSLTSVFALIKAFAIILAVVVLYNLGALSFTERIRDYATLRVLGFHHGELRSLASWENIFTTLTGWIIGIPAGWWFLGVYVGLFSTDRASYQPDISVLSLVVASTITIVFAMTATLLLTRRIKRIDMTSALKGVE